MAGAHAEHPGTPILHMQQFTRGRGRFHAVDHLPAQELPDPEYPLLLTTGRVLYHWHGGELTRRAPALLRAYPAALVEISPEDAARLGLTTGAGVQVDAAGHAGGPCPDHRPRGARGDLRQFPLPRPPMPTT